jgi:Ca2+-binding EF-hand superfamily protein
MSKNNQSPSKKVVKEERKLDIPADKLEEYREAFRLFDKDNSGLISIEEIRKVMKNMGNEMSTEEIKAMMSGLDEDGSGEITFEEFVTFMQRTEVQEETSEEDEVIRAFQTFDKDGNGWLSCAEFKHILTNLGNRFSDEEVQEIFNEADLNHDGKIEYREFVDFWRNK